MKITLYCIIMFLLFRNTFARKLLLHNTQFVFITIINSFHLPIYPPHTAHHIPHMHNIWYLCKNNFNKISLCHCCASVGSGYKIKRIGRERYFLIFASIFTCPCFPALKAYIVVYETIAQKNYSSKNIQKDIAL